MIYGPYLKLVLLHKCFIHNK